MGITKTDILLLEKYITPETKTVCELGSQNLYIDDNPTPPFASKWYQDKGLEYHCIDLAGDNGAITYDLAYYIPFGFPFDLVTDFGTSEHVVQMDGMKKVSFHDGHIHSVYPDGIKSIEAGFYKCIMNKHFLLKVGGICISVNPKTGQWKGHGYSYYTKEFYTELCRIMEYELLELGEYGGQIFCIFRKVNDTEFMSEEEFSKLDIRKE